MKLLRHPSPINSPERNFRAAHDRAWWRTEAIRTKTDWSSILRQRIRVLAWIRAGRPPLSKWHADMMSEDG
jgi:hypothetical protein